MEIKREYELIKKLGAGNQGSVWKALNEDGKLVALKKINISKISNRDSGVNEIDLLKKVSTPGCNPFISCYYHSFIDYENDTLFLEMEYIKGITLTEYSKGFRDLKYNDVLDKHLVLIASDLLKGINFLHKNGIIHRDIKPDNILITGNKIPKLVDLGLGCKTKDCQIYYVDVKCCDGRAGTPFYMSPETLLKGKSYYLSDIWSLGVTLYKSSTGLNVYKAKTFEDLMNAMKIEALPKSNSTNRHLNYLINNSIVKNLIKRLNGDELIEYLNASGIGI